MQTLALPYVLQKIINVGVIHIHKSALKMPEAAFIGCLAHELEHIADIYASKVYFGAPSTSEREIDSRVIQRGLGEELLALVTHHDSIYEKYEKEDGLTKKEIKKILKRQ